MTIKKRLKNLEISIRNANAKDVILVCKTVDGDYYIHGEPEITYTPAEFEEYKIKNYVQVTIFLWRDET